jgi:site-specific DNA-cytosine methylase
LLWEVERLLLNAKETNTLPRYLLLENVKNLIGKQFKANYDEWLAFLTGIGYTTYTKVLNAKNYGIPQNRERVFGISILGEHTPFIFPEPIPLTKRLKDVLDDEVDERYYLKDSTVLSILTSHFHQRRGQIQGDVIIDQARYHITVGANSFLIVDSSADNQEASLSTTNNGAITVEDVYYTGERDYAFSNFITIPTGISTFLVSALNANFGKVTLSYSTMKELI